MKRKSFWSLILVLALVLGLVPGGQAEGILGYDEASPIEVNTPITGGPDGNHYYRFTLTEPGVTRIRLAHAYLEKPDTLLGLRILDGERNTIYQGSCKANQEQLDAVPIGMGPGTYYVLVAYHLSEDVPFTLTVGFTPSDSWESERNDDWDTADPLPLNRDLYGADTGDSDYFRFRLEEPGMVQLSLSHPYVENPHTLMNIRVYDGEHSTLLQDSIPANQERLELNALGLGPGTYYVLVTYHQDSDVPYTLRADFTPSRNWESEPNDNWDSADPLPLNQDFYGADSGDGDYFRFRVEEAGTVQLTLSHAYVEDPGTLLTLRLSDGNRDTMTYYSLQGNETDLTLLPIGLDPGTYYVQINYSMDSKVPYTLRADFVPTTQWESENNNDFDISDPILINRPIWGNAIDGGDPDYFIFRLSEAQPICIHLEHEYFEKPDEFCSFRLYDGEHSQKMQGTIDCNEKAMDWRSDVLAPGTYFVKVYAQYQNPYTLTVRDPVASDTFEDLSMDSWYYEYACYVYKNQLMTGYSADEFRPKAKLTRAQLAQILYNKEGKPGVSGSVTFTDVDSGDWFYAAVTWAAEQGYVTGFPDGHFGPNENISREQLATILHRYAGTPGASADLSQFQDVGRIHDYALSAMRWAVSQKIVNGKGHGILDPTGHAIRAEVAKMIMCYIENIE